MPNGYLWRKKDRWCKNFEGVECMAIHMPYTHTHICTNTKRTFSCCKKEVQSLRRFLIVIFNVVGEEYVKGKTRTLFVFPYYCPFRVIYAFSR